MQYSQLTIVAAFSSASAFRRSVHARAARAAAPLEHAVAEQQPGEVGVGLQRLDHLLRLGVRRACGLAPRGAQQQPGERSRLRGLTPSMRLMAGLLGSGARWRAAARSSHGEQHGGGGERDEVERSRSSAGAPRRCRPGG